MLPPSWCLEFCSLVAVALAKTFFVFVFSANTSLIQAFQSQRRRKSALVESHTATYVLILTAEEHSADWTRVFYGWGCFTSYVKRK